MNNTTNFRVPGVRAGLLAASLQLLIPGCDADVGVMLNVGDEDGEDDGEDDGGGDDGDSGPPGFALCGDGQLGLGETCDLGPDNGPGSACRSNCQINVCGDYELGPEEECDDGPNNADHKACTAACLQNVCGDGLVGPGEPCDDGDDIDDDECTNTCTLASCGDAVVQAPEACDDGNVVYMVRIGPCCSNSIFYVS